ncbi:MAG: NUDIX domain-containing protein [Gemmatimonadaceae bacterium]
MNFEPQKFFVGVIDFFSILLPGALLAYVGRDAAAFAVADHGAAPLNGTESWMIFWFVSYLLGHLAFLFGALLDDLVYDPIRSCTSRGQIRRLAQGKSKSPSRNRWLARKMFRNSPDFAVTEVEKFKVRALLPIGAEKAINAFQWSKARLSIEHPAGLAAVQRFEADSKFFRSFCIVLPLVAGILAFQHHNPWLLAWALLVVPALWRYVDQRFKATQQAYWFIVTLESQKEHSDFAATVQRTDKLTHAGGVVYREKGGSIEYLLVQASANRREWVLPKGHIEVGEDPRETAVREIVEESGTWTRVYGWLQDAQLGARADAPMCRFYLMEFLDATTAEEWPAESRGREWLSFDKARIRASFDETRVLLDNAERVRSTSPQTKTVTGD